MYHDPIDVDFTVVTRRQPNYRRATAEDWGRVLELVGGSALMIFAMYCIHEFLRVNF